MRKYRKENPHPLHDLDMDIAKVEEAVAYADSLVNKTTMEEELEKKAKEKAAERKKTLEKMRRKFKYYPISEKYSPLASIPTDAHASYVQAAKQICEDIRKSKRESKKQQKR